MLGLDGIVYPFGSARTCPDISGQHHEDVHFGFEFATDIEATPDGRGYWTLVTDVRFISFAFVGFHHCDYLQDLPGLDSNVYRYEGFNLVDMRDGEHAVSLSALPSGKGYWVFTDRGRVIPFGSAQWYGDMSNVPLNGPILDSVATPTGRGYWMVASDGGIFAFGDAKFYGSMGGTRLNQPVMSMAPDPDGTGYWLVASDGGIFAFSAPFYGSMGSTPLNRPVVGIVASPTGRGYLMVAEDGGIFAFGDVPFHGSLGGSPPLWPIVSVSVVPWRLGKCAPPCTFVAV
ncbi:MAG TPA: hypothetical protein VNI78_05750, partial [Vicinamibacterales bacterium]|nr:hypothetical protein [Vicinamibacterales bacterium]